jgi:hypothetical protein
MCSGSGPLPGINRKADHQLGAKLASIFSHSENSITHLEVSNYITICSRAKKHLNQKKYVCLTSGDQLQETLHGVKHYTEEVFVGTNGSL